MLAVGKVNPWALLACEEAFGKGLTCSWQQRAPGPGALVSVSGRVPLLPSCTKVQGNRGNPMDVLKHSFGVEPG